MFRDSLRQDMVRQQLMGALLGTEFALKGEAEQLDSRQPDPRFCVWCAWPLLSPGGRKV
jgi:hypothetical protein